MLLIILTTNGGHILSWRTFLKLLPPIIMGLVDFQGFVGLVMGGLQSLSRSTYSKFLPETDDTASYFSFYGVTEKIAIVIGMLLFGVLDQITGSMRTSILFFFVFFVIGALMLLRVPRENKA